MVDRRKLSSRLSVLDGDLAELRGFDHARTHRAIQEDLGDLDRFAAAMARLL